jgi:hypothetical protein
MGRDHLKQWKLLQLGKMLMKGEAKTLLQIPYSSIFALVFGSKIIPLSL